MANRLGVKSAANVSQQLAAPQARIEGSEAASSLAKMADICQE